MPKFFYDEEIMREWVPDEKWHEVEEQISRYTREPDGQLSHYDPAQCELREDKLSTGGRMALQQIRESGVTQMVIHYNGGSDEGFAHLGGVRTATVR